MYKIVKRCQISEVTFEFDLHAPLVAAKAMPGHFVMLRIDDCGERIPLTVADYDRDAGTITMVCQVVGKTTLQLSRLDVGDTLLDFVGPLGVPIEPRNGKTIVFIGGGCGTAPVYPQARYLKELGNKVIAIIGARDCDNLVFQERMEQVADELHVCTDNGSAGHHGFVTEVLKEVLDAGDVDEVIAIGPLVMMRAVCQLTKGYNKKTYVSINTIMVDGTGMCGCCRLTYDGQIKFACVDGPDFDGHKVDFDELILRNRRFSVQEKEAYSKYTQKNQGCRCQ